MNKLIKFAFWTVLFFGQARLEAAPLRSFRCTIYDFSGRFPRLPQIKDVHPGGEEIVYQLAAEEYSLSLKINRWGILASLSHQETTKFSTSSAVEMRLNHVDPKFRVWCLQKIN